jgi:hypothetical protein
MGAFGDLETICGSELAGAYHMETKTCILLIHYNIEIPYAYMTAHVRAHVHPVATANRGL